MIQLQSRIAPYIGDADFNTRPWRVDDQATIVTKAMRRELRTAGRHGGEREVRIVNTRTNPELKL
jgi:hypothetical protein